MLSGRKLLLADDSATIQKVIDLTFSEEGVHVVSVNSGNEAIERLDEVLPDIVLADVFMPGMTGYEVCDYIKHSEKLSHIPVILLVGSFEPFDEEEARRVGADDIVSKPFQSIRRLVNKVGALLGSSPVEGDTTTVDFLGKEGVQEDSDKMSSDALELATADTLPLPDEANDSTAQTPLTSPEDTMATHPAIDLTTRTSTDSGDLLLDIGDLEPAPAVSPEDSILDIDIEPPMFAVSAAGVENRLYVESEALHYGQLQRDDEGQVATPATGAGGLEPVFMPSAAASSLGADFVTTGIQESAAVVRQRAVQEGVAAVDYGTVEIAPQAVSSGQIGLDQLAPEVIDAIARRAVAQLSERVVQEIAWEVVPQLAELMITRQLEEGKSQAK